MQVIAVIGDLIQSREIPNRSALQEHLDTILSKISHNSPHIASPYTLTLGDEFQAVYSRSNSIFGDLFEILAEVYPVRVRFSIGIGSLSTALNPNLALGMDGPAFHRAREAMNELKKTRGMFLIASGTPAPWEIPNLSLSLLARQLIKWKHNRLIILADRLRSLPVGEIAQSLQISKPALYKNINAAGLDDVVKLCQAIEQRIQSAIAPP